MSYKWMTPELKNVHRRMKREYWKNKKSEKWFNIYILFFINEKKQRVCLKIILGKDHVGYISALESCELEIRSQERTSYPSLWQRNVLNLLNIVISSLLQFINMNTNNYATRSMY